jgi:hypothetical protein
MKPKLKIILEESSTDLLLEIIETLCLKDSKLESEIEFMLNPRNCSNPQSYYNKYVKYSIDTNSWSYFPNKGVAGLQTCISKLLILERAGNKSEADKLGKSIIDIIKKCKKKGNWHNVQELEELRISISRYWY